MEEKPFDVEVESTPRAAAGPDLYHRPSRLNSVSNTASIVGWVILVIGVGIFGFFAYSLITSIIQAGGGIPLTQIVQAFITPFMILLVSLFLFAVLEWMSEVVYLWMDIEENSRGD
jgi:hypothetical protein